MRLGRLHKQGRFRCLELAPMPLATAEGWLAEQQAIWNRRLDRMHDYVEGTKAAKQ
jgi:hypothetical protein